ncbi:MAG: hypothetical protein M3T96_03530 [Acidobacteriota bacterium]|nr:hypothetical protein [Acidobacteriota bacterium]
MAIIRKTNVLIKTARKFIIYQSAAAEQIRCEQCGEQMMQAQTSADLFGISSRKIYRLIEHGEIHFVETLANKIYVCPVSIKKASEKISW